MESEPLKKFALITISGGVKFTPILNKERAGYYLQNVKLTFYAVKAKITNFPDKARDIFSDGNAYMLTRLSDSAHKALIKRVLLTKVKLTFRTTKVQPTF